MDRGKIRNILSASPKYEWIQSDTYRIADRLREIDPSYFVLLNHKNGKYEVHNTDNIGATFCFVVPFGRLDCRTLKYCRETRVERDVELQINKLNKRATKSRERARRGEQHDIAEEMAGHVKHIVQQETLSSGYSGTHYVRGMN